MDQEWLDLAEKVCLASRQMALKSKVTGSAGNISGRVVEQDNEGLSANAVRIEVTEFKLPGTVELGLAALEALNRNPRAQAILIANQG